jgi:hypothetical protein
MAPSALPGDPSSSIAGPFSDVDTREERTINTEFNFTVNKAFGMINVPVSVMEHDDESSEKRDELLEKFMGIYHDAEAEERGYLDTIGAAIAEDWQLGSLEVTAWTRNGQIKVGRVHSSTENKWIGGKKSHPITFNNPSGLRDTGISTDELMPYIPPGTTEPSGPGSPTDPGSPTNPGGPSNPGSPPPGTPTNPGNLALLDNCAAPRGATIRCSAPKSMPKRWFSLFQPMERASRAR